MKTRTSIACLAALLPFAAAATGSSNPPNDGGDCKGAGSCTQSEAYQTQGQDQVQGQEQSQAQQQAQEQANQQNMSTSTTIKSEHAGSTFIGGGDSTAPDQKVRAISGGWLTGNAGIRWDATDRDARKIRHANDLRARGLELLADEMECSAKIVRQAFGDGAECVGRMRDARESLARQQDDSAQDLQRQIDALREELRRSHQVMQEECDLKAGRAFEACAGK